MDIRTYDGKNVQIPEEGSRSQVHVASGEYVILGKSGQKLGDGTKLGAVYDSKGELMFISNDVDYNAFVPLSFSEAILYTAFEGATRKGVAGISRLRLKRDKGRWSTNFEKSGMLDLRSMAADGSCVTEKFLHGERRFLQRNITFTTLCSGTIPTCMMLMKTRLL